MAAAVQPTHVLGRYALYGEIARGGMATVHLARLRGEAGFARTVAIKRLHSHFAEDEHFATMLVDEARLVGRIHHPNVVQTLDVVSTDGELFVVMEYVHGESLSALLRACVATGQIVPPEIAASVVASVLHGLHAAHVATNDQGEPLEIVHRDVSPHNILVGKDGVARIIDFGVAKATGRLQSTAEGRLKGKIPYMSPEQIRTGAGPSTDIYASAVCLWEALAARRLFVGENEAMVMAKVLDGPEYPPSSYAPHVPRALDEIVMQGLAHEPKDRFATARDMARALEKAISFASTSDIGDWVEKVAGRGLAERAERVKAMESSSATHSVPSVNVHPTPSGTVRRDSKPPPDGTSAASPRRGPHLDDGTSAASPRRGPHLDDGTSAASPRRGPHLDDGTSAASPRRGPHLDDGTSAASPRRGPHLDDGLAEATQLSSGSSSAPHDRPSRAATPRGQRSPVLAIAIGVAAATLLAAGAIVHFRRAPMAAGPVPMEPEVVKQATMPVADDRPGSAGDTAKPPDPTPPAGAARTAVATAPGAEDDGASPASPVPGQTMPVLEIESPAPARRTPRTSRPPKTTKPKLNCNPPYVDDPATGRRKWRPECLP